MMNRTLLVLSLFLISCGGTVNESSLFNVPDVERQDVVEGDVGASLQGQGVGQSCIKDRAGFSDCRPFLKCVDGTCRATGDTPEGYYCILDDECASGLHCSITAKCEKRGMGDTYETCVTAADCSPGHYCRVLGLGGFCAPVGEGDIGAPCQTTDDCLGGLRCGPLNTCSAGKLGLDLQLWEGRTCEKTDDGPPRVYFEIPPIKSKEFFRLPWPNDIRTVNDKVDLTGFPTPGQGILEVDFPARLVEAIEAGQTGYSNVPAIYFRFSQPIDTGSIETGGDNPNVRIVDVEPGSDTYGQQHGYSWFAHAGTDNRYICERWLKLQSSWKQPLKSATRYAAILTKGIRTSTQGDGQGGDFLQKDAHLAKLLASEPPNDPFFDESWERYAVLRSYLTDQGIDEEDVIGAALFTTQDTAATHEAIRSAVDAWSPQAPDSVVLCDGASVSPCDDGLSGPQHLRGCFEDRPEAWEVHMKIALPVIQSGERPYLTPDAGGGLSFDPQGNLLIQGEERVCVSLTIPKGMEPPEQGYPLVIAGHGTQGSFRSQVQDFSLPVAAIEVDGKSTGAAVLSWDGPMHGPRRNSEISPELLYFNMGNPMAAQGNTYQGVADVLALVKTVKSLQWDAASSPTGKKIAFDASKLSYMGHSQGAGYGMTAVTHSADLRLGMWSGAGAGLVLSLLNKTSPTDAKEGVGLALGEINDSGKTSVTSHHPALTMIQGFFDPVDTLHTARNHLMRAGDASNAKHVFLSYGQDDTFTPPQAIETLAHVLGVRQIAGSSYSFGLEEEAIPASGNFYEKTVTGLVSVVEPVEGDGHFVLFAHPTQRARMKQFLGSWLLGATPTIN